MKQDCYGNGECHCEQCKCFKHLEGSQYFDNHCRDICSATREMDVCFINPNPDEPCEGLLYKNFNESSLEKRNADGTQVWVKCNITLDGCVVQYAAMRDDPRYYTVMIIKDCEAVIAAIAGGTTSKIYVLCGARFFICLNPATKRDLCVYVRVCQSVRL